MKHLGSIVIETERLYMRPFVLEDASAMFENWASDPETLKYVTWDAHASSERTRESIKRWIEQYRKSDTYKWAICLKTSPDQVIGDILEHNTQTEPVEKLPSRKPDCFLAFRFLQILP